MQICNKKGTTMLKNPSLYYFVSLRVVWYQRLICADIFRNIPSCSLDAIQSPLADYLPKTETVTLRLKYDDVYYTNHAL